VRLASITAAALLAAAPARADRDTAVIVGATLAARSTAASFSAASTSDVRLLGGGRLTLSFDDPPPPIPLPGEIGADLRLAPELLAGFVSDDVSAEGYVGAGLRGELWLASARRGFHMRTAMYIATRAIVIGAHPDAAIELALGEYLVFSGHRRFGWEGSAVIRPRDDAPAGESRELDALISIYVGW
jgi:hypothetical protein